MDFFSINNVMVNIPLGEGGYALSWIEAIGTVFGLQVAMPDLQPDAFPFWDSTMLVLSIAAMVLMTRKFVENWLLWVVIDVISVVIYAVQGVYAMSLEYVLLTAIAVMGSCSWIKSAQRNGYTPLAASAS